MNHKAHLIGGSFLVTATVIFYLTHHARSADKEVSVEGLSPSPPSLIDTHAPRLAEADNTHTRSSTRVADSEDAITGQDLNSENSGSDLPGSYWEMEPRPYPVSMRSETFEWTAVDGKTPSVMRQLATNPANLGQLEDEADWVNKRQLIYLVDGELSHAAEVFDGSKKQLKLPGFAGKEFAVVVEDVQIYTTHLEEFEGHFEFTFQNDPDTFGIASLVGDIWSIGYRNADESVYHQMISRRAGELILTQYDIEAESHHTGGCQCDILNIEHHHNQNDK